MRLLQINRGLTFREVFIRKPCNLKKLWLLILAFPVVGFVSFRQVGNGEDNTQLLLSLSGKWVSYDGSYLEEWDKDDDTLLVGAGYLVKNGKMIRSEKLAIVHEKSGFYYQAAVTGQNQGKTISFGPAVFSGSSVIFENAKHDFPNLLRYIFMGDSSLNVSVESIKDSTMNFQLDLKKAASASGQK